MMKPNNVIYIFFTAFFFSNLAEGLMLLLPVILNKIGMNLLNISLVFCLSGLGSFFSILFINKYIKKVKSAYIASFSCALYFIGTLFFINFKEWEIYLGSLLLGIGSSGFVTIASFMILEISALIKLNIHFSITAGLGILGLGFPSFIGAKALQLGINDTSIIILSEISCSVAFFLFLLLAFIDNKVVSADKKENILPYSKIISSKAIGPLLMSIFIACIFGSMLSFQALYAKENHLDYTIFYGCYFLAVVLSRILLCHFISEKSENKMLIILFSLEFVLLLLFYCCKMDNWLYVIFSIFLGICYGIIYPLIQTQLFKITPFFLHKQAIILLSLTYFIGLYASPFICAVVITHYGYEYYFIILSLFSLCGFITSICFYYQPKFLKLLTPL